MSTTIGSDQWCVSTKPVFRPEGRTVYQVGWWERREPGTAPMFEFPELEFQSEREADSAHARLVEILRTGRAHPWDTGGVLALLRSALASGRAAGQE